MNELELLKQRVKTGNDKLYQALKRIQQIKDNEERSYQMGRFLEAKRKLNGLCQELKNAGFVECLYMEEGKKTRLCLRDPEGWCQVCPSNHPYWEDEIMSLPSPTFNGEEKKAHITPYFTEVEIGEIKEKLRVLAGSSTSREGFVKAALRIPQVAGSDILTSVLDSSTNGFWFQSRKELQE